MKKETLLTVAVFALLLLNFGTLGYLLMRQPRPHAGRDGMKLDQEIITTLQLDDNQQKTFNGLKTAHHQQILDSDREYHEALVLFFSLVKNDSVEQTQYDSLLNAMLDIQKSRAAITFQHFEDLKNLCGPEQRKNFDQLLPVLTQVVLPHQKERAKHRKGI